MRISPLLVRIALVVAVLVASVAALAAPGVEAQRGREPGQTGRPIEDRYIVVLRDGVGEPRNAANDLARAHRLTVSDVYDTVLNGFAARVPAQALDALRRNPRVAFVDQDVTVAAAATLPTGVDRVGADDASETGAGPGPGAPVAVLDTGIASHPDLNLAGGYNCTSSDRTAHGDVDGHGTHVAGTIGANGGVAGVAPGTPLYAVKVLDDKGSGSWSSVICGLDWAAGEGITVANLSLGGKWSDHPTNCASSSLHQAICNAADRGVQVVVAAGNEGASTANYVPATYDQVTTVSALADKDGCRGGQGGATSFGADDSRATFSNRGTAVDVAAPGVAISSTAPGGTYQRLSGTSMATPHVAALLALGGYATEASGFGEPVAVLPIGDTRCAGDTTNSPIGSATSISPNAIDDAYKVNQDRTLRRAAPGVLGNDSGAGSLTASVVKRPRVGRLTLNPNGAFSYKPKANFSGTVSFTYRMTDAAGGSDIGTVTIRVAARRR
ncbi:MAG: S8 family serine peptidase [Chloroflexota bacterium]|nr:S8 family serine peptidase [Chloroflexota bacterium]